MDRRTRCEYKCGQFSDSSLFESSGFPVTCVCGAVESCLTFKPHKDLTKREGHLAALSGNQNFCSRPHLFGCRKEIFRTEPQRRLRRGAAGRNSGD
jgi:hypothetical protein